METSKAPQRKAASILARLETKEEGRTAGQQTEHWIL
jgi:hypothetical protein